MSSGHPHPSLFAPDHDLFDGCLGLALNHASTMPPSVVSSASLNPRSDSTFFSHLNSSVYIAGNAFSCPHFTPPFHRLPLSFENLLYPSPAFVNHELSSNSNKVALRRRFLSINPTNGVRCSRTCPCQVHPCSSALSLQLLHTHYRGHWRSSYGDGTKRM